MADTRDVTCPDGLYNEDRTASGKGGACSQHEHQNLERAPQAHHGTRAKSGHQHGTDDPESRFKEILADYRPGEPEDMSLEPLRFLRCTRTDDWASVRAAAGSIFT